ncbi:hypothetical protein V6N11_043480 [Hibiscus sabdariffa]|uniref:Reverse transcriptase zinc-binding domain-containing protein n=1 Tax=Hibiscus sabdariffa TaxID=183260 RepID=A0ABR2RCX4_9ROSI
MDGVLTTLQCLIDSHSATWKVNILFDIFDEVQAHKICSIPLSKAGLSDVINWRPDGSGIYSVKSGYRLLCNDTISSSGIVPHSHVSLLSRFYNEMWAVKVPSKVRITMWRIVNNFVPTYANLQSRRLNVNNVCNFCLLATETVEHIIRDCCFVGELFARQHVHHLISSAELEWKVWVAMAFCSFNDQQKIVMMVTFWAVWYSRNKLIHEGISPSVPESLSFIQAFIRECGSLISFAVVEPTTPRRRWSAPALNFVKCNFDSAFDVHCNESIFGFLCRNSEWLIMVVGVVPHRNVADAFMAEALACLQAVLFAIELGGPIVKDIRDAVKGLENAVFKFVHREGNNVAHALAREGRGFRLPRFWIEEAPPCATSAAALDWEKLNAD